MSIDEWLASCASWKDSGPTVTVEAVELSQLISDYVQLRAKLDAVEEWACHHAEGDGLRRVLWPRREPE